MKSHKLVVILFLGAVAVFSCKKEAVLTPPDPFQTEHSDTTATPGSGNSGITIEVEEFTGDNSDSMKVQNVGIGG